jgi:microcompartment protein CcmL/EutN
LSERDPALALLEFDSISSGIVVGDAMIKAAPLGAIYAGTVHPGRYLVMVTGDTASVDVAVTVGRESANLTDLVFLPDIDESVAEAVRGNASRAPVGDEALGIVETTTVAAAIDAADAGVKAADVELAAIRLADGLGGKGYVLFSGTVAEVDAAVEAASTRAKEHGTLVRADLIPQLHGEMAGNLRRELQFLGRVSPGGR